LVSAAVFIAAAPFASVQLAAMPAFIPAYESALVICDLITAALLFSKFRVLRSRALLVLASAYVFTAFIAVVHALSFPGAFSPGGLFTGGGETTAWLYMFWHAGFPALVIVYGLAGDGAPRGGGLDARCRWKRLDDHRRLHRRRLRRGLRARARGGEERDLSARAHRGEPIHRLDGRRDLRYLDAVLHRARRPLGAAVSQRARPVAPRGDVGLDLRRRAFGGIQCARYDLGWYAGRIYGLAAGSVLLVVLVFENGVQFQRLKLLSANLTSANAALEQLSLHDALTGLANRRHFDAYLPNRSPRHTAMEGCYRW
jgi:hypothetical protein